MGGVNGLWVLMILLIALSTVLWMTCRVYHYRRRVQEMKTVRLIISRYDELDSKQMVYFFNFVYRVLQPFFSMQSFLKGKDHFVWEIYMEKGKKNFYLSAPGHLLNSIVKNLQSSYPHLRYEPVTHVQKKNIPYAFVQLRSIKKWFQSKSTTNHNARFAPSQNMTHALLVILDESAGDAGIQWILTPQKKQKIARGNDSLFACDIRLFAEQKQLLDGLVNTLGTGVGSHSLSPESYLHQKIHGYFRSYWWNFLYQQRVPGLFIRSKNIMTAHELAIFIQLPHSQVRVSGIVRSPNHRFPVPAKILKQSQVELPTFEMENGMKIGIRDQDLEQHMLFVGPPPTGKTKAVVSQAIPYFYRESESSVIIASTIEEAEYFLGFIPPHRKVYIMDMDTPGEWGVNFLANDAVPADILVENLLGMFEYTYGDQIKHMDFIGQAFLTLRAARDQSPKWRKAIPTIDLRHIQKVLSDEIYRLRLIESLPMHSTLFQYWNERTKLLHNPRYHAIYIAPLVNLLDRILSKEKLTKTLCHPQTFDLKRALYEEKAIVILHGGNWDLRYDLYGITFSMFLAHVYHTLLEMKRDRPTMHKQPTTNLFFDDFSGFAGRVLMLLCLRSHLLKVRIVAGVITYRDIHPGMHQFIDQAFATKVIFRTYHPEDAHRWSQQMNTFKYDDLMHLPPFYAAVWLTVDKERQEPFIAKSLFHTERMKYENEHSWPMENKNIKLHKIILPDSD